MKSILSLLLTVSVVALGFAGLVEADTTLTPITTNDHADSFPQVHGDRVVWQGYVYDNWEIFLYHIPTGLSEQLTDNHYDDTRPQIHGNFVVWQGYGNLFGQQPEADWEIFLYDISTQETIQITTNNHQDISPVVAGEWVAWMQHSGNTSTAQQILLSHIPDGETVQLTGSGTDNVLVHMDSNSLLWAQTDDAEAASLFVCDFTQDPPELNPAPDDYVWEGGSSRKDGNLSVFAQYTPGGEEIFLRHATTRQLHRVTNNSIRDEQPAISRNRIVWTGGAGISREIYLGVYRNLRCLSPGDGAVLAVQQAPAFAWEAIGCAEFKVEFSSTESFEERRAFSLPFRTSVWLSDACFTPSRWQWRLIQNVIGRHGSLYWRVKGQDDKGTETLSEPRRFSFETTRKMPRRR